MLSTFLLILLVIDSLLLMLAVLFQAGQGGGVAASFGGVSSSASSFLGTRQTGNLLTKASWWCGGIFLGLAFVLSLVSAHSRAPKSVLDQLVPSAPAPVTPVAPSPAQNPGINLQPAPTQTAPATKAPATPAQSKSGGGTKAPASKKP